MSWIGARNLLIGSFSTRLLNGHAGGRGHRPKGRQESYEAADKTSTEITKEMTTPPKRRPRRPRTKPARRSKRPATKCRIDLR